MKVDWAIPCRFAEVHQGGATIVGAGCDVVPVQGTPTPIQVLFAVRYVGAPDELDGATEHAIGCRIFNPAGEKVGEQAGEIKAKVDQLVPGYVADVTIPTGLVIEAQEFGTYGIEFWIDDHSLRVPIHVIQTPQQH
ncbi:MAG: hypothetical protein ACTHM1_00820 [Solirubrobacteraceae bacterium]|jgi:hypothetical protein